jgi:hypothetical protein
MIPTMIIMRWLTLPTVKSLGDEVHTSTGMPHGPHPHAIMTVLMMMIMKKKTMCNA